jgi:hypothetical protein
MESNVNVEAGPVVVPKVPPIPDVWIVQIPYQHRTGTDWVCDTYDTEAGAYRRASAAAAAHLPYRIVRIPGEEVKP